MKIIFLIYTAASNSPILARCLLMAFNDIEKWKHKNFLEKQYTGAHTNVEQKPYGAALIRLQQSPPDECLVVR